MIYAFEWYEREPFLQGRPIRGTNTAPVLVVWLDEDQFGDFPIPRLDLFLRAFGDTNTASINSPDTNETWLTTNLTNPPTNHYHSIMLVGPGRSDTLKAIFATKPSFALGNDRTNLTKHVSVFLASPRAIDQVLLTNCYDPESPRLALVSSLTNYFQDVKNLAPTDSDLAWEVLDELRLRGLDFSKTNENHLVLIGGWDEYFGRMLSAAYAGEIEAWPSRKARGKFFDTYAAGNYPAPTNLHTFLYLSGLDGQGLSTSNKRRGSSEDEPTEARNNDPKPKPSRWTPDENRAEGPAQYDYLGRLAGRMQELNRQLVREGKGGRISAVGIGGGDAYDTLLILQALRPRFPDAVFFTTQLDARFCDPEEWKWSRNLLVVTGYGLRLSDHFQLQTAPFRDSDQTATFAATLSALGCTNLPNMTNRFPVQRFEIGRNGPVTLSPDDDGRSPHIHPDLNRGKGLWDWLALQHRGWLLLVIFGCAALLALCLSTNVQQFTVRMPQFLAGPLWLKEEDIGGLDGFVEMAAVLGRIDPQEKSKQALQMLWLRETIKKLICHEEEQMEADMCGQEAPAILTELDIRDPAKLIKLMAENQEAPPSGETPDPSMEQNGQALASIRASLPSTVKALIAKGNLSKILPPLIKALRTLLNTVDLFPTKAPGSQEGQHPEEPVLWRKNRKELSRRFAEVFAPPIRMSEVFFPAPGPASQSPADAKNEIMQIVKDAERHDCLQSVILKVLHAWNSQWSQPPDHSMLPLTGLDRENNVLQLGPEPLCIGNGNDLDKLKEFRENADKLIEHLLPSAPPTASDKGPKDDPGFDWRRAAASARAASLGLYDLRSLRWFWLAGISPGGVALGGWMLWVQSGDQPFWLSAWSGASLWPSNWIYLSGVALGFLFISESYFQLRTTLLETTRECRLNYRNLSGGSLPAQRPPWRVHSRIWRLIKRTFYSCLDEPVSIVEADDAWSDYQSQGRGLYRCCRTIFFMLLYFVLVLLVFYLGVGHMYKPVLRQPASFWYGGLAWVAFLLFLFLSFWTIDAAFLCRWLILRISQGPTLYSLATRRHFARKRGQVPLHVLSEWIDVSVIAHITERVGALIYFPAALLLLIILGNDDFLYYFPWPPVSYLSSHATSSWPRPASSSCSAPPAKPVSKVWKSCKINSISSGPARSPRKPKLNSTILKRPRNCSTRSVL
ncbi:MAG: hypothetical protein ACLQVY_11250 [Limisphaerales bacterium]